MHTCPLSLLKIFSSHFISIKTLHRFKKKVRKGGEGERKGKGEREKSENRYLPINSRQRIIIVIFHTTVCIGIVIRIVSSRGRIAEIAQH